MTLHAQYTPIRKDTLRALRLKTALGYLQSLHKARYIGDIEHKQWVQCLLRR